MLKKSLQNDFSGQHLNGLKYKSLRFGDPKQFLAGDHVTTDKGTGLIHTAPAYGHEDFLIALKHKIPIVRSIEIKCCTIKTTSLNHL